MALMQEPQKNAHEIQAFYKKHLPEVAKIMATSPLLAESKGQPAASASDAKSASSSSSSVEAKYKLKYDAVMTLYKQAQECETKIEKIKRTAQIKTLEEEVQQFEAGKARALRNFAANKDDNPAGAEKIYQTS